MIIHLLRFMNKFLLTILGILHFVTSTGINMHIHYCMGKTAYLGLGHNQSKICGICGMEKSDEKDNGCCKDEQKFVKNENDQKNVESFNITYNLVIIDLPVTYFSIPDIPVSSVTEQHPVSHAPPRSRGVAVYIRNCTFLI